MTSRVRQSQARRRHDLPEYEPPAHPLNPAAQRALQDLLRTHQIRPLQDHIRNAGKEITEMTGAINDRLMEQQETYRKRSQKRESNGLEADDTARKALEEMRTCVEDMTVRMENSTRKIVDNEHFVTTMQDTIQSLPAAVGNAASQRGTQQRQQHGSDDEAESMSDFESSVLANTASSQFVQAPSDLFSRQYEKGKTQYELLSLSTRYADHPTYAGFKRTLHDAHHPGDEAPPVPDPSTWFDDDASPEPGATGHHHNTEDSDDDVAIARATISTKCPLTLQELKQPITSTKCPHTFEKEAILNMIRSSGVFAGGNNNRSARNGERTCRCPVTGCQEMLTEAELRPDPVLLRKIRRIQKSRNQEPSDDEDEDPSMFSHRAQSVVSDSTDQTIAGPSGVMSVQPKIERRKTPATTSRSRGVVLSLSDSSDEQDE